jgi:hypothetical protein
MAREIRNYDKGDRFAASLQSANTSSPTFASPAQSPAAAMPDRISGFVFSGVRPFEGFARLLLNFCTDPRT